ncbi:uncharacterized protein LOC144666560 isoform X2 [Oculina patagonica]
MAGQTDSEFRSVAITETSRNVQYNFSSPISFECPDTILSTPLSSTMPHTVRMESNNRVFTPIPFQSRVPTPYPVIDSVSSAKDVSFKLDWSGPSPESRMFSPSWGFESTIHIGQQFQGALLPMATGNSHTVHHYAFPQSWHHAVTPQNFSGYNLHSSDVWYGDCPLIEGLGAVDVGNEVIEQDSKVTSSTEVSPWKPQMVLPPVSEFLNPSHGNLRWQNESISPVEAAPADETCQLNVQLPSAITVKPKKAITKARTQTPWKLKKQKSAPEAKSQNKRKGKPRKLADPLTYMKQKTVQKERERKIRNELTHLSTMLPCNEPKNRQPSKKEILENAISHIMQLQENIREAYMQKGLKTEDLKAILQDNNVLSPSQTCFSVVDQQNDADLISEDSSSLPSPPELTIDENFPSRSVSPISELSSHESVEMLSSQGSVEMLSSQGSMEIEEISTKTLQNGNAETLVNHVKRPMNAFLLYSQQYRKAFKVLYPGRDNREISTILAKHWREMKPEQKEPYREKARELMRRTRETHPDFKYCEGKKETGVVVADNDGDKHVGQDQGYRIGSHILRQRTAVYTITGGKGLEPSPKRSKCEQDIPPNIKEMAALGMTDQTGTTAVTALKPKLSQMVVHEPAGITQNQGESACSEKQILESHQGGKFVEVNVEWYPSTSDMWVQCETCKKWHMLPDESYPATLPNKWFCPLHVKVSAPVFD